MPKDKIEEELKCSQCGKPAEWTDDDWKANERGNALFAPKKRGKAAKVYGKEVCPKCWTAIIRLQTRRTNIPADEAEDLLNTAKVKAGLEPVMSKGKRFRMGKDTEAASMEASDEHSRSLWGKND